MSVLHLDTKSFETTVAQGTAMIDFWASWCGPCKSLTPTIEALAEELENQATVGKVNVDEERPLAAKFNVMSIPTVIFFKDGVEKERLVGAYPKEKYLDALKSI